MFIAACSYYVNVIFYLSFVLFLSFFFTLKSDHPVLSADLPYLLIRQPAETDCTS